MSSIFELSSPQSKSFTPASGDLPASVAAARDALAANPYDEAIIGQLESAVQEQVSTGHYCLEVNLGLLKLYKTYPSNCKDEFVQLVLVKSLMALPSSDFSLALALVPKKLLIPTPDPTVKALMEAAQKLELAQWKDFWATSVPACALLDEKKVAGVLSAVRAFVIGVINISFAEVPRAVLEEGLSMSGSELDKVIATEGYTKKEGELYSVGLNTENQPRPKKFEENISLQNMMGVIQLLSK